MVDDLDLIAFHYRLAGDLSRDEARAAAADLGVDWNHLPGRARPAKLFSLLEHLRRHDRLRELADWMANKRRSIAAPAGRLFAGVPALPEYFVGRDALLDGLAARLTGGQALALTGPPGVGKTALAAALVHHPQVLAHFHDGVLWAALGPAGDPLRVLNGWAAALGQEAGRIEPLDARRAAVTAALGERRVLLVVDDARSAEAAAVLKCGGPNCVHLFTAGDPAVARALVGSPGEVAVPPLAADAAARLLAQRAPDAHAADRAQVRRLAEAVAGLPLALELLGGYLAAPEPSLLPPGASVADAPDAAAQRLAAAVERLSGRAAGAALQETVALSLDGLRALPLGEEAVGAFYALGAVAPAPESFPRQTVQALGPATTRTVALLAARGLLALSGGGRLLLHPALHEAARRGMDAQHQRDHWEYYLTHAKAHRGDGAALAAAYGQLRHAWARLPADDELVLDYVVTLRDYQIHAGLWTDALAWAERGATAARALGRREEEGLLLDNIAHLYNRLGRRQEALTHFQRALAVREALGDPAALAAALNNVGAVYNALGQRQEALAAFERALPVQEQAGDHAAMATTLNNIGSIYYSVGRGREALGFYERARPIQEQAGDRAGLATTLNNIGLAYAALGQPQQALETYQQALPLREAVGDRVGQATTLNNIGSLYQGAGRLQEALDYYRRGLALTEAAGDRAGLVPALNNIGLVHRHLGQNQEALAYYERALPVAEEIGDRPGCASVLSNIGSVNYMLGRRQEALGYFERAVPVLEEVGDRAGLGTLLNNIGGVYQALGRAQEALDYLQRALALREAVGDQAGQATTLNAIGGLYNAAGRKPEALAYYERALPLLEAVGNRHAESVTRYNIALIHREQGRLAEAVAHLRRVVELDRLTQNPDLAADQALLREVEAALRARR